LVRDGCATTWAVAVALFAYLATRVVAKYGFVHSRHDT
jgi:hypothetical protein